jgi:hypothetical protein
MPDYTTKSPTVVAVTGTTAKTVLTVITPSTRRARIKRVTIGGLSVTSSHAPGTVELVQWDTDGTGTARTPTALDASESPSLCTSKSNYTAEPTTNEVIRDMFPLSPQGVTAEKAYGPGEEIVVPVSKTFGVRVTMPDNQNIWPVIEYSE